MMTYNELCAKLILKKTINSESKKKSNIYSKNQNWLHFFPFLNFKLDLTTPTDWDLDS